LPDGLSEIFLRQGLDSFLVICPSGRFHRVAPKLTVVIPGRASWRESGIHTHDRGYGFRACALRRIYDAQLPIGE
jgi:hypothetical protein